MQLEAPAGEKVPALQLVQFEVPSAGENEPAVHREHVAASDEVALKGLNVPTAQTLPEHADAPVEDVHVPGAHGEHEVAACEDLPVGP